MKEVRWKPEEGERYYFIDPLGNVNWHLCNSMTDSLYYKVGNCFRTEEEAQHVSVLFKKLLQENILRDKSVIEDCNQPETNCSQLPDWCKVGEWVWTDGEYHKIIEVGKDWFRTSWGDNTGLWGTNILHQFKQAHLRPYTAEEMKALVGKVIEWDEYLELVTKYNKNVAKVYVDNWWADAKFLMNNGYTIDGAPCGKLEHLEDGEWTR